MLILTRKVGEAVCVGDHGRVIVLSIRGNQIRLGFDFPKGTAINREEVDLRIRMEALRKQEEREQQKAYADACEE